MKNNWQTKKLGEVCRIEKKQNSSFLPYVGLEDIESNTGRFLGTTEVREVKSNTFYFTSSHVLYGRLRPYLNKVFLPEFDGHCSTEIFPIIPNNLLDRKFLFYWLTTNETVDKINSTCTGARMPRANMNEVIDFEIPVPPIQEQKRIVAILDQAFADIEKLRANTERNLKNARELFESYAKKVLFSTARGWIESTIGKECNLMTGGTPSKTEKKYFDNGTIRWLVSGDVHKGIIEDCEGRITKLGLANSNAKYLPTNSVVIALNGQGKTRGTVALLKVEATCNQSIVSIFPKESSGIFSEYILLNLQSRYNEIRKMTGDSGNDRRGLNMPLIRSIKISFPSSYEEQQNMIRKLTILKELNNDLVLRYQEKINYLDQLKKSILQKAFTGQLTKHEVTV
ncbi:MAG: hypothetical protein A3C55_06470 [Gammaproteobacteria bacterium RIFCSPHIGHO2_02_FULL_42_13]|nr:MAG: hypothetical protein A3C55_06470 [Gammaproteobacteria bacterium RIFCSPHIGHO2_02_FULL_42_13]